MEERRMKVIFHYQETPLGSIDLREIPRVGDELVLHLQHYPIQSGEPILCTVRVVRRIDHMHGCFNADEQFASASFLLNPHVVLSIEPTDAKAIQLIVEMKLLQADGWARMIQRLAKETREAVIEDA